MTTEENKLVKSNEDAPKKQPEAENSKPSGKRLVIAVIGVALLFVGFGIGWLSNVRINRHEERTLLAPMGQMMERHHGGGDLINPTDGTTSTRLTGVVTQASGDSFTIAGNGTTKTITTNSSTVYAPESQKAAVNDSVVVIGKDANGTFTASSVHILNK